MKRSPMPNRKEPMRRGAGLGPGQPIKRTKAMKRGKSRKVLDFEAELDALRPVILRRSGGRCEIAVPNQCLGRAPVMMVEQADGQEVPVAANVHHRRPRGQGGSNDPANLLHLCGSGTTGCHGYIESNRTVARANGWLLEFGQDPRIVPVISFRDTRP